MSDLIITPSSGKIDFIYQSGPVGQEGQTSRLESIIIDPIDGLVFSGKISASSVNSPLNITATSSNINYPFIFASSGETGAKSLLMDSAGGTYNPSTNLATVNISGTSSWATNAVTNANLTGDVTSVGNATTIANSVVTNAKLANSSVTIGSTAISLGAAGAQTTIVGLVSVTSTTFVGALTGTATTASYANALNAANSYTVVGITGNLTGTATTASYANNLNAANQYTVGGITGSLFGTSSWASNAVTSLACTGNAATVTNGLYTNSTLTAGNLSGTIPSAVLGNSTVYIGSTAVPLNRANTAIVLTGITSIDGNAATATTATTASYANNLNAANQYTVGGITGSLFGTSSWATNATNATNALTATNATQLNGQAASYYTNIPARLGYTPVDKAGDTVTGNLIINGNFSVNGSFTAFSASNVYISSSQLYIEDNILTLNAFSPYLRYAGVEMYDSGSGTLSSLLWDGEADYFFLSGSSVNGKIITGPDSQANLSANFVPKATAGYKLGNSVIYDDGTNVGIGTTIPGRKLHLYAPQSVISLSNTGTGAWSGLQWSVGNGAYTAYSGLLDDTGRYFIDVGSNGDDFTILQNGSIGIGIISPIEKLHVLGNIHIQSESDSLGGGGLYLGISNSRNIAIRQTSTNKNFAVDTYNASESWQNRITILNSGGNVGIGTTVPAAKLQVNSTTAGATLLRTDGTNGTLFSVVDDLSDSLMSVNNSAGLPVLEVFADDRIVMGQYGQNDFVLVNNKVGIGTNNPVAELHVTASSNIPAAVFIGDVGVGTTAPTAQSNYRFLQVNGTNSAIIETMVGGARIGGFDSTSNTLYVGSIGSYPIVFRTAVDEKMRIAANGNVGIGTSSPAQKLEVQSGSVLIRGDGTALFGTYYASAGENTFFTLHSGSGNTFHIGNDVSGTNYTTMVFTVATDSTGGNVGIGTTNPVAKLQVAGNISGSSFTSSISNAVGFLGTSSWASNAVTSLVCTGNAATATTASYANALNAANSYTVTGITGALTGNVTGTATTASYANALNAANRYTVVGITGSLFGTSSWASNAVTSLVCTGNAATATTASYANALNAANSYTVVGITGALTGNVTGTATTASYANALNAANQYTVGGITGSHFGTSSWATNAVTALNVGNGTITIAGGTGVGVGSSNTFTTNQSGATTVTITNTGVTSAVAGTGVSVTAATGPITFSIGQAVGTTATPTFASVSATTFTGTATTASYANALNAANSYTVTNLTASNIYATDGALFNFKAQRIPLQGAPQQGTHKGYLILAKAYTSGNVDASYVIGKVILRRGTSGTGHDLDIYEVNSSRGYNTEIFQVSRLGTISTRFLRLVKVTYGGVVYHAIETSNSGGQPSTEMYFEGSIIDSPLILTDETFVSSVSAFGNAVIFVDGSSNVGIGTTSPLSKLHISGSGQTIMRLDSDTTTNVSQFQIKAASDAVLIMGMLGGSATGNNYGVTAAGQAYIGTTTLGTTHPTSLVIGNVSTIPTIFSTNNVERMRIDGTGLVGIGTTVPSTLLHAYGSDGRYFTYSGTSGAFTIQRNAITTGGATPVLSLINTQGMDASTGRGTSIQLDLGYGGSSSVVGTAARGARIATLGETVYDATAANQNAVLAFFTSTAGSLTEKLRIRSDGSLSPITVSSTTAGATLLRTDGTNGTLFSVVDDLSDSLMSVNNSAGLPVLEVFADDRIVAGQYGQNDFVVVNNKVGIGTNNPLAKLHVTSSTSIPSAIFMGGNVGIGTTSPAYKLDVGAAGGDVISVRLTPGYERVRFQTFDLLGYNDGNLWMIGNNPTNTLVLGKTWDWDNQIGIAYTPGTVGNSAGVLQIGQISKNNANYTHGITRLYTNGLERITIIANGNVGINQTFPTTPLHVVGVISGSSFTGAGTGLTGTAASLTAGTATSANALNASNNYQVNSIGVGIAGSGTAGRIGMNEAGIRSWSITPTGGRLVIEAGDGLGSVIFSCPVTSSNFVGPGTGLTGTAAGLSIGGTAATATNSTQLNGVAAASYVTLTGTQTLTGKTISGSFSGSLTGNASTATILQNARDIGGVSFNGSANINLPGVNTAGNQNTSGTASYSLNTALTTAATYPITSSWASNAVTALQLGGTVAASYVTLAGTQTLTSKTLNSPVLVTPALGTPSSGDLTSCTFPTLNQNTTGTATTASYANALNAANTYTVTNLTVNTTAQLKGVKETYVDVSHVGNVVTIDLNAGTVFRLNYNAQISSFTISSLTASKVNSFTLISIPTTGAGGINFTFTGYTLVWAGNSVPYATQTGGKFDVFSFIYDGSRWYGFVGGLNY